ncbi:major facilitator superfamily domain-containing protein 12-like isoform X1 [Palaemon carinicauda]|uniref:major facilitator superfamily domain-containing protein 12-like isoform X1 n=1 Tax=Palaemon carinicauda TaxID=392227 RepID=UPI0035B575D0
MANLAFRTKLGYGVGHVLNDLCSAMWFTYLLIYFHHVLLFNNTLAGVVLLIGQVADGLATPFVGHEADRTDDLAFCSRYGRKKTWHLLGSLCVLCAFPFIFLGCLGCAYASDWAQLVYYSPFVVIFQFGWASSQISHLSLIPSITQDPHDRTELNAIRYGFTVMSNIAVYLITWLVLGLGTSDPDSGLGPDDTGKFRVIVFTVLAIGTLFAIMFHVLVKEENSPPFVEMPDEEPNSQKDEEPGSQKEEDPDVADCSLPPTTLPEVACTNKPRRVRMSSTDWLKNAQFYQVAVLYMGTRLFCNLTQAYVPIYLQDTLRLPQTAVAYIPLVMYVSGFLTTTVLKCLNKYVGRKISFLIGCFLGGASCICVWLGTGEAYCHYWLYAVAALMGAGASIMLVTSLSITADLIGPNVESGAFVYGAMSFTDKLSNGFAVMIIQHFNPCTNSPFGNCCPKCAGYFRDVLFYYCGGAAVLCVIALLTLLPFKIGSRNSGGESSERETGCCDGGERENGTITVVPGLSDDDISPIVSTSGSENHTSPLVHTVPADYHADIRARVVSLSSNSDDNESNA